MYGADNGAASGLIAGLTMGGLIGGMLFSSVGFVAFIYGKKNTEFKPMVLGVLLMGYPFFIKGTIAMYVIGAVLTAALFLWRE